MSQKKVFEGSMVALVTPFKNGKVDEAALKRLLDFHVERRTDVIIPCGTTGESATLSHEEHRHVMSFVMDYVDGRVPVVCGCGSNNTAEALGLITHAKKIKADGVLVVTPYYNRPTQEGLYRHYKFLASNVDIPFILYNVPGRTGVSIAPETVARLAKIANIVAIKEASGSLAQVDRIRELCDITVLSGDDALTLPMISVGARGVISVTANVVPHLVRDMVHLALEGHIEASRQIHQELRAINRLLFIETNPIPVKTALGMMKMIKPEFRMPLCEMKPENEQSLRQTLTQLGVLE
ncbi:MAG: 4-hydroxy-tetrahydrodipicolinate synthase [Candidatus Omnitrophica bacterium]|nr:4-hydroxy-tetrahydrodipicolinate synthase [Candidatus Omnitrophota bacterium]MDD5671785.1 4-hydroxy-tetrahydrodipicolinate synthase [Candidatus Omnitrophota bacterium]